MKKLLTILLCALMVPAMAEAQSAESIKKDKSYIWAEGTGDTVDDADQDALQQLSSQISVWVESKLTVEQKEEMKNGKFNFLSSSRIVFSSFPSSLIVRALAWKKHR